MKLNIRSAQVVRWIVPVACLLAIVASHPMVFAAYETTGQEVTVGDVETFIESGMDFILTIGIVICAIIIIYAGILMAFPAGKDGNFAKGKTILWQAIIGLIVLFGVNIIVDTIANFAQDPTNVFN